MRMTNKIMRNNAAYNINQNKILQDKLTNQMTNQSKIVRPSDDPVVAIRALRLRSNVTTVTQYNEKNAKDADQWLTLTADAMKTVDEVLNELYKQDTTSADKYETADDLRILMSQMKQLTDEFYSCANVDYAGRFVFSGYRTDLPVTFTEENIREMKEHPVSFNIDEKFGFEDISRLTYTDFSKVGDMTQTNTDDVTSYEQQVTNTTMYRFRISYNGLDSLNGKDAEGNPLNRELNITMPDGSKLRVKSDGAGGVATEKYNETATPPAWETFNDFEIKEFTDQEEAYKAIADGSCTGIAYIPTSGELVFSKDFNDQYFSKDAFKNGSFQINYDKSEWKNGDINPVHYFQCTETKRTTGSNVPAADAKYQKIAYNTQRDQGRDQDIYYDVGYNQQIQVNTRADEIFTHDVGRDIDDLEHYLKQLEDIEKVEQELKTKRADYPEDSDDYKDITKRLEGVEKAKSHIRENVHTRLENQITYYQQYMDDSRVAMTDNATRGQRLTLIANRLENQQATFKELQQDNEGIDITEVAVELTSSELTYNAALMATGKIMQTNLMNYI